MFRSAATVRRACIRHGSAHFAISAPSAANSGTGQLSALGTSTRPTGIQLAAPVKSSTSARRQHVKADASKLSDEELAARIPDRSGEQQLRYAMAIILPEVGTNQCFTIILIVD